MIFCAIGRSDGTSRSGGMTQECLRLRKPGASHWSDIAQLLVDPAVVAAEKEKERKEAELATMAAWDSHLASNPDLKAWAKANPGAAKAARAKWEAENAKK